MMDEAHQLRHNKMTKTSISKLVSTLAIPTVISMLVTAIYNTADTYFVSKLGVSASGAVTVVFSLMAIIQSFGFMLGMGAGSIISRKLGAKQNDDANIYGSSSLFAAILVGLAIMIFGLIFLNPLMTLLGAKDDSVLMHAKNYGSYILFGAPIMASSFVLNNILRAEGKANLSMIGLTFGGILNIILDPIFITTFNLGTKGAAIATVISQTISFLILLSCFLFNKSIIKLSIKNISRSFKVYFDIVKIGFPSFCRQTLASISTVMLNNQAYYYGGYGIEDQILADEMAVAAQASMGIVSKVTMMLFSVGLGIGQGYQPVLGYNYGAKEYKRVKEAFWFTLIFITSVLAIISLLMFIFAPFVIDQFVSDSDKIIDIGIYTLRAQCIAMPFVGLALVGNMTFQSLGRKLFATILSCLRQGIYFIPLIYILPLIFGLDGVMVTLAVCDILTFFTTIPFVIVFLKEIKKKSHEQNNIVYNEANN